MSQDIFADIDPDNTDGGQLAVLLGQFRDAVISGFSGPARPPELLAGGYWIDTSLGAPPDNKWLVKLWTGVIDITLFDITTNSGIVTIPGTSSSFYILKQSNDAVGAELTFEKQRIAGTGQVLNNDTVGTFTFHARDDGGIKRLAARIDVIASEDVTDTSHGTRYEIKTTDVGAGVLSTKIIVGDTVEIVAPVILNGTKFAQADVATNVSIPSLSCDKAVIRMTGSTATTIHGISHSGKSKIVFIHNVSTADITLQNDSGTATDAKDKFALSTTTMKIKPLETLGFFYDASAERWKSLSGAGTGGGGGGLVVADITARNAIPSADRYDGLKVYVISESWNYQLRGGILDANWTDGGNPTYVYVADTTARNSIPTEIRRHGLQAFQRDTQQLWILGAGLTNSDWYKSGGSGPDLTVTKTANATLAANEKYVYVDATAGNVTITLPAAVTGNIGEIHEIQRVDAVEANTVTIVAAGSDTINGVASDTLPYQWNAKKVQVYAATKWGGK